MGILNTSSRCKWVTSTAERQILTYVRYRVSVYTCVHSFYILLHLPICFFVKNRFPLINWTHHVYGTILSIKNKCLNRTSGQWFAGSQIWDLFMLKVTRSFYIIIIKDYWYDLSLNNVFISIVTQGIQLAYYHKEFRFH